MALHEDETNGRTVMTVWLREPDGRVRAHTDSRVMPAFVVIPEPTTDPAHMESALAALASRSDRVLRVASVTRRPFPSRPPGSAWQVSTATASGARRLARAAAALDGVAHVTEEDVTLTERYASLHGLAPGMPVDASWDDSGPLRDIAPAPRSPGSAPSPPAVRVLAIEAAVDAPDPARITDADAYVGFAWARSDGASGFVGGDADNEATVIRALVPFIAEQDPDVIATFGGDARFWPRLAERAGRHGVTLSVGRDGSPLHVGGGRTAGGRVITAPGRACIDFARVAARDLKEVVKVQTLANVTDHLAGALHAETTPAAGEDDGIGDAIGDRAGDGDDDDRALVVIGTLATDRDEATRRATSVLLLARDLLPLQYGFARLTRTNVDVAARVGRGRQVESLLVDRALREGLVIPKAPGSSDTYLGGLVLDPEPGLHENVTVVDVSSMYPSIMRARNVGPDTYVEDPADPSHCHVAPGVGHAFLRTPDSWFRSILDDLIRTRRDIRNRLAEVEGGDADTLAARTVLDVEQAAVKVFTNALYGYTGWPLARWHHRESAEATTAWGRALIAHLAEGARDRGLRVLYGDTDSLFLAEDRPGPGDAGPTEQAAAGPGFDSGADTRVGSDPGVPPASEIHRFIRDAEAEIAAGPEAAAQGIDIDIATRFSILLFTDAKKRYAGLTDDDRLIIRGFETRRGDWCAAATHLQEEVIRSILEERGPDCARELARERIHHVAAGHVAVQDLIIWRTLTRAPDQYDARQPHAEAARRAMDAHPERSFPPGSKIGYIILAGKGPIHARTRLAIDVAPDDSPDHAYYVDHQLIPVALRVLAPFGVGEQDLRPGPRQRTIEGFL